MRLAVILDPLDALKPHKDSSLAIMREAQRRGHTLFVLEQGDLLLRDGRVRLRVRPFVFTDTGWQTGERQEVAPEGFDAILMRKDPPFDLEYLTTTWLLECAEAQGARVFNGARALRDFNEKLAIARFSRLAPPFVVSRNMADLRAFLDEQGDIVVKPLDGMGGSSVFRLHRQDPNIAVILETITHFERRTVMAQRYLPEIAQGDKRILLIDGAPVPYALARVPKAGELRGNLAAGGTGAAQPLSARDREIAEAVGAALRPLGLFLVGLDVIGDHLTEINVTSPTCMVEIATQTGFDPAATFMEALERACGVS